MKFTTLDIKDNRSMVGFIRSRVKPIGTRLIGPDLLNVYDSEDAITVLESKIQRNKTTINAKFVPMWESHIKYLEKLSS